MAQNTDVVTQATPFSDTPRKIAVLKINDTNIYVKNSFCPDKSLHDILFSIANTRLKEKLA